LLRQGIACGSPPGTTTEVQRVGFSFVETGSFHQKSARKHLGHCWPSVTADRRSMVLCASRVNKNASTTPWNPSPAILSPRYSHNAVLRRRGGVVRGRRARRRRGGAASPQHASDAGSPHSFPLHFLSPSPFSLVSYHERSREVAIVAAGDVVALPLPPSPRALSGGASGPDPHSCSAGPTST
jgi:hypothetical protein